jgi:glutathione synthase
MKHLFVIDPLDRLLPKADTTIAFMREATKRGHQQWTCLVSQLGLRNGVPFAWATETRTTPPGQDPWYQVGERERRDLEDFDVVWMRKDPPFDMNFYYVTHVLSMTPASTLVTNNPTSLRNANEKLFALKFPAYCPESLVSRSIPELLEFRHSLGGECIVKPLDGAGGEGIFHLLPDDRNAKTILEVSTRHGQEFLLAQRYIPEIRKGDKRIIMVEGKPEGAVLRVPTETDARANFHAGGSAARTTLTARDLEICDAVGPSLVEMGILFAGIDVIGDWLTEVNVTSPTGIREIFELDGTRIEESVLDAVEARVAALRS